jgi:ABC-type branched-subunit amino acid transport system ATPase component
VNVIETSDLGKRYGKSWALRDCTLAVPEGCLTALVGPNGAGKTNLGLRHFFSPAGRPVCMCREKRKPISGTGRSRVIGWVCVRVA